jgi:uncharacterized repeat protein (TIGR01451 family)
MVRPGGFYLTHWWECIEARRWSMLRSKKWLVILSRMIILVSLSSVYVPVEAGAMSKLQVSQSDWPMLQHDAQHSGYTPASFVAPDYSGTLQVKWKVGLGERVEVEMQPIVAYERVYIGVMNGKLHAINEETGTIEWTYQAGGAISHTPAAGEGKVFFGSEDRRIYALDALTGQEAWIYETGGPILSSPVVHNQTVYVGSFDHHLYAINTETGQLRWRYDAGGRVWTSPSLDVESNRLYFGSEQPKAHCLNATTGHLIWDHRLTGEGMRNTYPTLARNVVIFQTIKPGVSAYKIMEDPPKYIDDATSLRQYAGYYSRYPETRHLYYLNASTGTDMWDGHSTSYVPVVIPYWGMLNPVIDPHGYAWIPVNSGGDTRNIDLYKVDLSRGNYIKVTEREDFFERGDETGHFSIADDVYFSTVLSSIGKYDPRSNKRTRVFGPYPGNDPFECRNLDPMPVGCPYVDRMAGTTGFGGMNRASGLVVANGAGFFVTHGWLYALTPSDVPVTNSTDLGTDFTTGPPEKNVTYGDLVAELNERVRHIISYGHLEPFPYLWNWGESADDLPSLWHEGEVIRSLSYSIPYLTEDNKIALKRYLKNEVLNYLLDPARYSYKQQCQVYGGYVEVDCTPEEYKSEIRSRWYANNENYTAERVYAVYAYAKYTDDWQLIEDNWDFVVSRYNIIVGLFDRNLGHAITRQWLSGQNLDLQTQAACFYAMKEMATHVGDDDLANQAEHYYNQVILARVHYGKDLIPELYDNGALTLVLPEDVGNQKIIYPPGGIVDRETDIRQLGWRGGERIELRVSGVEQATVQLAPNVYEAIVDGYDYPVGYLQAYPEIEEALSSDLVAATQKYVSAIAYYNPWWYWGENGHCSHKGGENLYSKPFMAAGLFQAKAYILQEDFETLKDYLPWPVNRAGFRDVYRLQNLVALLQAEGARPEPSKNVVPGAADVGQFLTYTVSLVGTGTPIIITDTLPSGLQYVVGTAQSEPNVGFLEVSPPLIRWSGIVPTDTQFTLSYVTTVVTTIRRCIVNNATVVGLEPTDLSLAVTVIANGSKMYLPLVLRGWK